METNNVENGTKTGHVHPPDRMAVPQPVVGLAKDYSPGDRIRVHQHSRAQLLYASAGVMTVTTQDGVWVVPPFRAVWIPAATEHRIRASGKLSMRTLYIDRSHCAGTPEHCCVVSVSPLLRELILHAVKMPECYALDSPEQRIMSVILDQVQDLDINPLSLPIPRESRLKKMFMQLSENPGDQRTLEEWGNQLGATRRTLSRLFRSELGMSFGRWRQQIRILESLRRLAANDPVIVIATDLGYDSPSAFIAMFKKTLGKTPGQYFSG